MCALSLFKKINKYLVTTIIIILLYLCCTSIAYADITVKTIPTNLVVNHTKDEMKIILEFNMNGGTATITDASSVDIFSYSLSSAGSSVGDGYRLIITITDTDLINDILSGADPIDITFPSGTISNGASDTNSSDIHVTVVTPPVGTSFNISDTNEFKATATLTTSGAGTHVVTFFNKADFELHYPDEYSYFDIVPKDIQYGKLVSWGPDIKQFKDTVTISGNSLSKDFSADAVDEKPYVGVYYTESPAGQAGATDYGAYLFMSSVAEGVENDGNSSGRPALIDPKRLMSYRFSDFQGPYNAYLIATFDNDIESNIFDNDSTSHLALGIDFKQDSGDPYISMRYPNNFDATINGKQLIIMMDDTRFGSDGKLFFQIPKGSIKDKATGKSNKDPITIVNNYDLNSDNDPRLFTHGAIELNSIDITPYGNDADVELKLTGSGSVYNSYVPANEFDVTNLVDFATLMASATEDLDTEIFADNTTEYIGGLASSSLMTTKLSDLQPETDYLWISTAMLISTLDGDGILEGHVTKFMTEPAQLGMEMIEIEYFTGDDSSVNDDDYVVVTYSEEFSNYGNDDDYNIWIDYDSNGSLDILLDTDDYTVSADPQQLGPNQVKIEFEGDMESHLINILNATLKVEVKNPSNLEPVVQNGKHYQTVHIPNRIAKATNVRLINTSPALNLESNAFHQDDTYVFYSLLYSHLQTIEATGTIAVDKIDPLSTLNTSALTDYPVTATITAEEGHLTHTYELSINSNSALLEMITVNGVDLSNFSPYTKTYNIELAEGTTALPIVVGKFDSQITPIKTINYATSGSLSDTYIVKVQVMNPELPPNSTPELEYVLNFTVASSPDDNNSNDGTNNNDSSTSGNNSSSSSDKDKKSKNDSSVTSNISTNTGSLLDSIDDASNQADDTPADSIINLIDKIETPAGARIVLDKMPETLEDLMTMKASLDSLDDSLKMDADIAKLIAETERLISLLTQSKKSQQHVQNIITPLGEYYDSMNSGSLAANQVLIGSVAMTNASIEQAGTLHLNWSDVEIEDGRVYLTPSPRDITQAIRAANQIETSMENLLDESLTPGLSSGIISTITYEIPSTLENAAQTGVVLNEETINTLTSNNVGQVDLNMGPVTFGMDNNFLNNYSGTNLEFNVSNQGSMSEEESDGIPDGSSEIGAPVLDLTSFQNSALDEAFDRPIVIEFNLDYFGFTPIDDGRLYIGRWNNELKTWDAVGGAYDGSKNTITANRTHLSKYTVLKSDKNYSTLEDSWAKNEIASLKNKGIIEDDSLFNGSENITREEFACWVSKAYGLDATNLTEDGLGIDTNSAYYEELQSLYSEAQVSGAPPNQFDSELTKEELAVLIANALDSYDRPIDTDAFELAKYEEDLPTWAVNSVETVVENGVVDESFFGSAGAVTKEEAANILYQVYN